MNPNFIYERIAELRGEKNISARDMSLSIGQNENYINMIENGKSLPSMENFLYICDFLEITPYEFFDPENKYPDQVKRMALYFNEMNKEDRELVESMAKKLAKK